MRAAADMTAAICLVGLPRMLHQSRWDTHRRAFLNSLLAGGMHAELFFVTSAMEFDAARYRRVVANAYDAPVASVRAFNHSRSARAASMARCRTDGAPYVRGGDAASAFYVQADKAKACYDHVLHAEARRAHRFDYVVRVRVDWLFTSGPALASLSDTRLVYARLRCFTVVGNQKTALPASYMSYNFPTGVPEVSAKHHNCRVPSKFLDDGFVVAPRESADALFVGAHALPCPHEDAETLSFVRAQCAGLHWPECYLQAALHRAGRPAVGPIPVDWHFPGWSVMEQGCEGLSCSWNHPAHLAPQSNRSVHSRVLSA
tara:strand:+ start:70 stop:1017 length:948 start_codon:yes stop_codon:yes gene_type:complete